MIEIFDKSRRRVAIAENSYAVSEQQRINAVWRLCFSIPGRDPKNEFCKPFYYVRHNGGELYRIMPETLSVEETGDMTYQCEHVLATLIDNILFGYHVVGNLGTYTADAIQYVLDHQLVKNWVLDECDYRNQFEYGWEQESLLSALFSIAAPLAGPYIWRTNTAVYPWRLSLKRLDTAGRPEMYVRRRHNMTGYQRQRDPQNIVTRLYPLGYGEGVNQLGISNINGGIPYLQSPKAITDKYGIIERVWTDRRYEDPASLKAAAEAMLQELQEPAVSYEVGCQEMAASDFDKAAIGKRVRIVYPEIRESVDTFITEIKRDYEDVERSSLVVANKETSIAASLADLADRQRIEQTYSQGATQIYSQALQANCDRTSGAVMDFFIPEEMRIINKVLVKIRVGKFRAYSKSTESDAAKTVTSTTSDDQTRTSSSGGGVRATSSDGGATKATSSDGGATRATSSDGGATKATSSDGGATRTTSSDGGATKATSSAGGGSRETSSSGGGSQTTSSAGGGTTETSGGGGGVTTDTGRSGINVEYDYGQTEPGGTDKHGHRYRYVSAHQHAIRLEDHTHDIQIPRHTHEISVDDHTHSVNIPNHTHVVALPNHKHDVVISNHRHEVDIPNHTHDVTLSNHRHEVEIPNHKHDVTLKDHAHTVTIPGHAHKVAVPSHAHSITPGIFQFGNPQTFGLYVNGTKKADFPGQTAELDITAFLTGRDNRIPRGSWLSLEVRPDDLAYISIDLIVQGFIQSRGDKTV